MFSARKTGISCGQSAVALSCVVHCSGIMFSKGLAVCILLFLSIPSFVHCGIWEPPNPANEHVCRTPTCLKRGKEYFDNLNSAVDPCDNFYSFVCGGWYVPNKPPEFLAEWSTHDVMEKRVIKDLKEILDKPASPSDRDLTLVKHFYDVCMKRPYLRRKSPKEVAKHITAVGRFGKKKLWDIHQGYLQLTGESAFFEYSIYAYPNFDLMPLVSLREVESAYGAINHDDWKVEEEKNYSEFLFSLMKSMKLPGSDSVIKRKIKDVLFFREMLSNISNRNKKKPAATFEAKTARGFQEWYTPKPVVGPKPKHPEMPWENIIKTILTPTSKHYHDSAVTTARHYDYFKDLEGLLSVTSEEVLVDHMEMNFAERHTLSTPAWEDLLEKTVIEPHDIVQPIRHDVPRYIACIRDNNVWSLIGNILQRKWFRKDIVPLVREIFSGLKLSLTSQVKDSTWLDEQTKTLTVKKIQDIKSWIGYPPWYSDPTTDEKSEASQNNPLRANAYLDMEKWVVYIKSPMLQPPIYDPELPNVFNLGGIGYIVGHELYHTIQNCGTYYDPKGKIVQWWNPFMRDRCRVQMGCFIDAYNKETQREFQLMYHETIAGGNSASYLENYPDVMGLDASFRLFQALKKKDKKVCQTLPRFEKYTCEQMFFIAYGNTMCGKMTAKAAKDHIKTAIHSLDSVRVNGAVMNNKEFQKAFQCGVGKPMNPDIKCNLWL